MLDVAWAGFSKLSGEAVIVYARTRATAMRDASQLHMGTHPDHIDLLRTPEYDQLRGRRIPASLMVQHGWEFACAGCGKRIDGAIRATYGLALEGICGNYGEDVFCTSICKMDHRIGNAATEAAKACWLELMEDFIHEEVPGSTVSTKASERHADVRLAAGAITLRDAKLFFRFPGMRAGPAALTLPSHPVDPASGLEYQGPQYLRFEYSAGDRGAFEKLLKRGRSGKHSVSLFTRAITPIERFLNHWRR